MIGMQVHSLSGSQPVYPPATRLQPGRSDDQNLPHAFCVDPASRIKQEEEIEPQAINRGRLLVASREQLLLYY